MKLSIVVPTLGRKKELAELLESLAQLPQEYIEVIIVDQNAIGFLDDVLAKTSIDQLQHCHVHFTGAARARNWGFRFTTGDVVNFCDDDANVVPELYTIVKTVFANDKALGMATFKVVDPVFNLPCMVSFANTNCTVSRDNFNTITIEFAQFWRRSVFEKLHGYDETLGIGVYYGADEGQDIVIRAIEQSIKMEYFNQILFFHPQKYEAPIKRYYQYARGTGRVLYLHGNKLYVVKKQCIFLVKSFVGFFIYMLWRPNTSLRYGARFSGFIVGFLNSIFGRYLVKD